MLLPVLICLVSSNVVALDQWVAERNPIIVEDSVLRVDPFTMMNSSVKDQRLLIGRVDIDNRGDGSIGLNDIRLVVGDKSYQALDRGQLKSAWKGSGWLSFGADDMARSSLASTNILGQTAPPHYLSVFTAAFLVPKKLPKVIILQLGSLGEVQLAR